MQRVIYSRLHDSIDAISYRYYGSSRVELILSANPRIHEHGAILPIGTPVIIPPMIVDAPKKQTIQLWD
ncbi:MULTISPECIES: tail protein X [Moraxella]|uniref:Phage tail protein n=1 Tax=Moraxella catarrhalis TaxID=480 RepID=A0A7Z1A3P8_MORCA|nr:tail protein X [Moraxella catarrhalis]OAV00213.1 hypothetical protein AO382_1363 [Moraxella catarrhalis]STY82481.1 Phage Tail Protein X [Moraxella catarrhalis]